DSECCLSQHESCECDCHTACSCAYCHTVGLKARSTASTAGAKPAASRISTVLGLDSRPSTAKAPKLRRWSRRNSTLKPLRLFA
ncbi:hypothetical protein FBU31_007482, partial [Coemansia sp. 'formosensis']